MLWAINFCIILYLWYFILSLLTEIYFCGNPRNKQLYLTSNKLSSINKKSPIEFYQGFFICKKWILDYSSISLVASPPKFSLQPLVPFR